MITDHVFYQVQMNRLLEEILQSKVLFDK